MDTVDRILALLSRRVIVRQRIFKKAKNAVFQNGRLTEALDVLECVEELLDEETDEAFRAFEGEHRAVQ